MTNAATGGLLVNEITVTFGGLTALDNVSLSVEPGEIVGVIGPNGAGKTTLFNVVCGFVRPDSGTMTYRGRQLRGHQPHDLAKVGIARTLQGVGLFAGMTVVENVMAGAQATMRADFASALFGLWRSSREEARLRKRALDLLEELRIAEWARRYPATLPYAIQKRTSLARALISGPTLVLLDEPASGLSEGNSKSWASSSATCDPRWACSWSSTTWTWSCPSAIDWSCSTSGGSSLLGHRPRFRRTPR